MNDFSRFCNTCHCSTDKLLNISVQGEERIKHILLLLIEDADIINANMVYLCTSCYGELKHIKSFRDMCLKKFLQFRKLFCELNCTLQKKTDQNVSLKSVVDENVSKRLHSAENTKNNYRMCDKQEGLQARSEVLNTDVVLLTENNITIVKEEIDSEIKEEILTDDEFFDYDLEDGNRTEVINHYNHDIDENICQEIKFHSEVDLENASDECELTNNEEADQASNKDEFSSENKEQIFINNGTCLESVQKTILYDGFDEVIHQNKKLYSEIVLDTTNDKCDLSNEDNISESDPVVNNSITDMSEFDVISYNENFPEQGKSNKINNKQGGKQCVYQRNNQQDKKTSQEFVSSDDKTSLSEFIQNIDSFYKHDVNQKQQYNVCDITYENECQINEDTGMKQYKCNICGKTFLHSSNLDIHKRVHTGNKPYQCTFCHKFFSQLSSLNVHKRIHTGSKPYKCTMCDKAFSTVCNLDIHERIHTGTKPYKCTVCDKTFSQSGTLKVHKRIHTGSKPYKCTACDKSFSAENSLIVHKRVHTGNKPYKCTLCDKFFSQLSNLNVHKLIHTGSKPYKCAVCNKSFSQGGYLNIHKRVHTGNKPFKCTVCNKAFDRSDSLNKHKPIHSGIKPYKCTICNKAFLTARYLTKHKRIHTKNNHAGDKPYKKKLSQK